MDDDIDFEVSVKKTSVRKGRRARGAEVEETVGRAEESVANTRPPPSDDQERPTRRVGGWGEAEATDGGSAKARSGRRRGEPMEESVNTRFTKFDDDDGSDNDIPIIPDLEDSTQEDSSTQIAIAPSVAVNKVTSYQDLDKDLQRTAQFSVMNGVDLKLLTRYIVSEAETIDDDKMWHWDHVFTEVSSELQTEWDANEVDAGDGVAITS